MADPVGPKARADRRVRVRVAPGAPELAAEAAGEVAGCLAAALVRRRGAYVALAGGSTPRLLYERLGEAPLRERVAWDRVHLFWGDERCVPQQDEASNYRLVRDALLARLPPPGPFLHRIRGELGAEEAARRAAADLEGTFGRRPVRLDLVLLGLGADGHVASLFPGGPELEERRRLAVPTVAPQPPRERVSLTLPVLSAARTVIFLVAGEAKAEIVATVLGGGGSDLPAGRVRPVKGRVVWWLDRAAAARL